MGIEDWIKDSESNVAKLLSDYCIVDREFLRLDDIKKWGYQDFINFVQKRIPKKLYKYFPNTVDENNVNYSLEAIVGNTVHLSFPSVFDDIYDSDITVSFDVFERLRLIAYCKRMGINFSEEESSDDGIPTEEIIDRIIEKMISMSDENKIYDFLGDYNKVLSIFNVESCSEIENLANELFSRRFAFYISKISTGSIKERISSVLYTVLRAEYFKCLDNFKNTFKTTCFATNPYSQLMWGGTYANCHRGFCIEYEINDDVDFRSIYENLFPLVYSKIRSNIEHDFINQLDTFPSVDTLKDIYIHGALRKSLDWSFQDEWRLLLIDGMPEMDQSKVRFFPISKVYIGYRMSPEDREKIMMICKAKGIECVGVRKRHDIFEMEEYTIEQN